MTQNKKFSNQVDLKTLGKIKINNRCFLLPYCYMVVGVLLYGRRGMQNVLFPKTECVLLPSNKTIHIYVTLEFYRM